MKQSEHDKTKSNLNIGGTGLFLNLPPSLATTKKSKFRVSSSRLFNPFTWNLKKRGLKVVQNNSCLILALELVHFSVENVCKK